MKINKTEFKALVEEAIEKAKFVRSVEVVEGLKFPSMSLANGILSVDSFTWSLSQAFLPGMASFGVTRFLLPMVIGSFTGVTQLAIVVFILINLAQTKFGKPVEFENGEQPKGADAGIVDYINNGLWSMTVRYSFDRLAYNFGRQYVTLIKSPKSDQVAE